MAAQVKIFSGGDDRKLQDEINAFLKKKGLTRDQVTIKQSQSTFPKEIVVCTITLLYDETIYDPLHDAVHK